MILGLSIIGWIVSFVLGFAVGGLYFLSIKVQVDYVLAKGGPLWIAPAALYGRIAVIAVILILLARFVDRAHLLAIIIAALAGAIIARILISRMVQKGTDEDEG